MEAATKAALQECVNTACESSPRSGKTVTVYRGKHKGKAGVVFYHGRDQYRNTRYDGNWAQEAVREAIGLSGFRIGVQTDSGERFFTQAEYTVEPCDACGVYDKRRHCQCADRLSSVR